MLLLAVLVGCMKKPAATSAEGDGGYDSASVSSDKVETITNLGEGSSGPKVKVYSVRKNDNLWNIARRPEVYGNGWLYPLLYKANADLLSHPDKLEPGTKLIVPRGQSVTELEAAKEDAMASEFQRNPKVAGSKGAKEPAAPAVAAKPVDKPVDPAKKSGKGWLVALIGLAAVGGATLAWFKFLRKPADGAAQG
jgi:LysM repeat protein